MHDFPFQSGIIIGRFQMIHIGHVKMIQTALNSCAQVLLFIGSSQESNTTKNPLSYEQREHLLSLLFQEEIQSNHLIIKPLPDIGVGNNTKWGEYVLQQARNVYHFYPDVMISGREERRTEWFDDNLSEILIAKNNLSATLIREAMLHNDKDFLHKFTPPILWDEYEKFREILFAAQANQATASM